MLWIGVDVGGTFTDAVLYDDTARQVSYAKAPSTPADPTQGVIDVIDAVGVPIERIDRFVHGITIGTNSILQAKGATVWMLVTRGFRDVLEIARTNRLELYDIKSLKPPPVVERLRVREVDERLYYDGTVHTPLDEEQVRSLLSELPTSDGDAIAVCFVHSYAHADHERRALEVVREVHPELFSCASSDVLPEMREYDRFNTTALNAYIGPLMARYMDDLQGQFKDRGYQGEIFIMTSNGGLSSVTRAQRLPISTVLSGPAGGVAATVHLGSLTGFQNLITCDMGGTSTDVCLIEDLEIPVTNQQVIGPYVNRTPQIAINAVGAGGGSIAWLDAGDILMVGPQSAGADPGPACYGHGGTEPTVTDANLVLNRLSPGTSLAGRIALDRERAVNALRPIMSRLSLDELELADGIVRIAIARMVSAIKQISITNGHDPRDFALCAYGGAGPMHAAFIAEELEIDRVIIPLGPGNFAAMGALISDIRQDHVLTRTLQPRRESFEVVESTFLDMEATARQALEHEGVAADAIDIRRSLGMRYLGQSWELEVEVPATIRTHEALEDTFGAVHDRRFGHRSGAPSEIVSFRVAAIGRVNKPELAAWHVHGEPSEAELGQRQVFFDGAFHEVPIYDRARLPLERQITGPAVIEESGATTVLPPRWRARVLGLGDLYLEKE